MKGALYGQVSGRGMPRGMRARHAPGNEGEAVPRPYDVNCASSVEPVSAVTDEEPPCTTRATSSK